MIASTVAPQSNPSITATDTMILIWALGVALMIVRLGVHFAAAIRLRRNASQQTSDLLTELSRSFKVRTPTLLISSRISKPLLTGIFKPAIILPCGLTDADPRSLDLIFKHELAHLKRRDLA